MNRSPRPALSLKSGVRGKNLLVLSLLLGLCLSFSGCDMKLPPMPWDPPKPKEAAKADEQAAEAGGDAEPPKPVDELDFAPPAMKKLPFEEVNVSLKDGMVIYGRLYDPSQKPSSGDEENAPAANASDEETYKGPKYPLVILLHGIDRDHTTWNDLPALLVKAGYSVFSMDLRGHGKSTHTVRQRRVSWRLFEPETWQQLPKDVDEVIEYFQKGEDYPQIDGKTVALVGEKLGANVAVFSGRDKLDAVKALVLISPGLDYKGIIPSQAVIDYTNSALLITTQDDPYSYKSTERLYNWLLGLKALQVYKKIGDGSDMLSHQSALGENIVDWLSNQMPSPEGPKTKPEDATTEEIKVGETKTDIKPAEKPKETVPSKPSAAKTEKAVTKPARKSAKKAASKPQTAKSKPAEHQGGPPTPPSQSEISQPPVPGA